MLLIKVTSRETTLTSLSIESCNCQKALTTKEMAEKRYRLSKKNLKQSKSTLKEGMVYEGQYLLLQKMPQSSESASRGIIPKRNEI